MKKCYTATPAQMSDDEREQAAQRAMADPEVQVSPDGLLFAVTVRCWMNSMTYSLCLCSAIAASTSCRWVWKPGRPCKFADLWLVVTLVYWL